MRRPLGCMTGVGLIAGVFAALAIGVAGAVGGNSIFSPGELNAVPGASPVGGIRAHADLSHQCDQCHAAFWDVDRMGDRCLACHQNVTAELALTSGFHSGFANAGNCRDCHTDHRGREASLTLAEISNYPHGRTGFSLSAHPPRAVRGAFRCTDCHPGRLREFSTQACLGCHDGLDPEYTEQHLADFGTSCLGCHDGVDHYGVAFDHESLSFGLIGGHQGLACSACHRGARTALALRATSTRCLACHRKDDIHASRLGQECQTCHTPQSWADATLDHRVTGFALVGSHATVDCLACHVDRHWSGVPADCAGCHQPQDPHAGQFTVDCDACHAPTQWSDIHFNHQTSAYPLVGAHLDAACDSCHTAGRYVGTPTNCVDCHASDDRHDGRFGQDCSACHQPTRWEDVTFDHNLSRFPLTGAHRFVACLNCHEGGTFSGTPIACSACHSEPQIHRGVFGLNCGACHSTSAWLPASWNGPHSFPMKHGGAGGQCSTCHPSSYAAYTCYGCHKHDPAQIAKKHQEEGIANFTDCVRCHLSGREGGGGDGGDD